MMSEEKDALIHGIREALQIAARGQKDPGVNEEGHGYLEAIEVALEAARGISVEARSARLVMSREDLKAKHPQITERYFGDGWNRLIDRAATEAASRFPGVQVIGGKEKYARLELYFRRDGKPCFDKEIQAFRNKVAELSTRICEDCGSPGKVRFYAWHKTHCDACYLPEEEENVIEIEPVDLDEEFEETEPVNLDEAFAEGFDV